VVVVVGLTPHSFDRVVAAIASSDGFLPTRSVSI